MKGARIVRRAGRLLWRTATVFMALTVLWVVAYRWIDPPVTPLQLIRSAEGYPIRHRWVPIEQIAPSLVAASIASEDNLYIGHGGFDWRSICEAVEERRAGRRRRGASTITQQTAKNVFLWPGRSWVRKGFEAYFTVLIELFWGKRRTMEVYLNVIETGPGLYGAEAASQHYFGCPARRLTAAQASLLVASYPAPLRRNPSRPSAYLLRRAAHIRTLMRLNGPVDFSREGRRAARDRYRELRREEPSARHR